MSTDSHVTYALWVRDYGKTGWGNCATYDYMSSRSLSLENEGLASPSEGDLRFS